MPFALPAIVLVLLGSTVVAFLHHRRPNPPTVSPDSHDSAESDRTGIPTDGAANLSQEGAILFDLQPPEIRDRAIIQRGDTKFSGAMTSFSQTPGEAVLYRVDAPGYESYMTKISVRPKETRHVSVRLVRQPVPVSLVSIPPGIPFYTTDNALVKKAGEFYLLPWGSVEIVARHPRLGARTNSLMLSLDHPNSAPPFRFNFGALILTNLPQDCSVTEGSASVGTPADRVVYEPLGPHTYLLHGKSTFQTVVTNIVAGENYLLPTSMAK
jgi:hypothetical protein